MYWLIDSICHVLTQWQRLTCIDSVTAFVMYWLNDSVCHVLTQWQRLFAPSQWGHHALDSTFNLNPVKFCSRWYPSARKTYVIRPTPLSSVQGGIQALGKPMLHAPPRSVQFKVVSKRSENLCYTPHPVQFSSRWYPSARKTYIRPTPFSSVQSGIQAVGKPIHAPPRSVQFKVVSKHSENLYTPHPVQFSSRWYLSARKSP